MKKYQYKTNINCGGCISTVTPYLTKLQSLSHWDVDIESPDKILTVETDNPVELETAVREAGFTIEPMKKRFSKWF